MCDRECTGEPHRARLLVEAVTKSRIGCVLSVLACLSVGIGIWICLLAFTAIAP